MNLQERYQSKATKELVQVLETPSNYQPEAVQAATEVLKSREEPYEKLFAIAEYFQRQQIIKMLNELDPLNDELSLPISHFLSKAEMKELLVDEFQKLLDRKDGFRFDVWQYSLGGL